MFGKAVIVYAGLLGLAAAIPKHKRQNASTTTSPGTTTTTTTTTTTLPSASTTTAPRTSTSSSTTTTTSSRAATSTSTSSSRIIVTSSTTSTTRSTTSSSSSSTTTTTRSSSTSSSRSSTLSTTSTTTTTSVPRASTTTAPTTSTTSTTTTTTGLPPNTHVAVVTGAAAVPTVNDNDSTATGSNTRRAYSGDGTPAQGWPEKSQWVSFDRMFTSNTPNMRVGCSQYNVPANSEAEIAAIRTAINTIAAQSYVDHRLILAHVMQESTGCVRVPTTTVPQYNIYNPGLMQDFNGTNTCNCVTNDAFNQKCGVVTPCPAATIQGMIRDGAVGTNYGEGLADLLNIAQQQGSQGVQTYYVAANWYNQGRFGVGVGGNLSSYGVDIANRLTGWLGNGGVSS